VKRIAVLGSTGSIGRNTLDVIRSFPETFCVAALSAHSNIELLTQQAREFDPRLICVTDKDKAGSVARRFSGKARVFCGFEGLGELLSDSAIDLVVLAISGASALLPLWWAIENRKNIALANKEALVMAGPLIARKAKGLGLRLMPIDSEQSAIWQCLDGKDRGQVRTVYLTASGGPFWQKDQKSLARISVKDALAHPRWKMGRKITIDSATFMNKGLEVLEAMYLFDLAPEKISIVIHPESVVHSMVEFVDGTIMAQVSATDMRIPIQYALSYPARLSAPWPKLDLVKLKALNFAQPKKFPCLRLAYEAAAAGGTAPCVLNAANEVAVEAFVNKKIGFTAIPKVIEKVLRQHTVSPAPQLMEIVEADQWARRMAQTAVDNLKRKT